MPGPAIILSPVAVEIMRHALEAFSVKARAQRDQLIAATARLEYEVRMEAIDAQRSLGQGVLDLVRHIQDRRHDALLHTFDRVHDALLESRRAIDAQLAAIIERRLTGTISSFQMVELGHVEREYLEQRRNLDAQIQQTGMFFGQLTAKLRSPELGLDWGTAQMRRIEEATRG